MEHGETEIVLLTDKDWSTIDGECCRVNYFRPLGSLVDSDGKVKSMDRTTPYASVNIECKKLGKNITGFITHKVDFKHLWAAFKDRKLKEDEEVIIIWSKKHYKRGRGLFSDILPKLWVMVYRKGYYEAIADPSDKLKSKDFNTLESMLPIISWKPDVME